LLGQLLRAKSDCNLGEPESRLPSSRYFVLTGYPGPRLPIFLEDQRTWQNAGRLFQKVVPRRKKPNGLRTAAQFSARPVRFFVAPKSPFAPREGAPERTRHFAPVCIGNRISALKHAD
jgi:hypothetical protein